jgi:hypothetical protein
MTMSAQRTKIGIVGLAIAITLITAACGAIQVGFESTATPVVAPGDQGRIDEASQRSATAGPPAVGPGKQNPWAGTAAIAWYGHVASTPGTTEALGALVLPFDVGEIALEASDPAVRAQIEEMKDAEAPGRNAHFWGKVSCEADRYENCVFTVDYLRRDGPGQVFEPQPVEGWEGAIYGGPPEPGSGGDDYFALSGPFHIQYGLWAGDEATAAELAELRDTGQAIQVWGRIVAGASMDWNGTQIQVERFELVDSPTAELAPAPQWEIPDDGWMAYVNDNYKYQFRYPPNASISEHGVEGFPSEDLPEDMTPDEYMASLQATYGPNICVGVETELAYLYISPPVNSGGRFTPCGPTGLGAFEIVDRTEQVTIGTAVYQANGMEFIGEGDNLEQHGELMSLTLPDGTRLAYGSRPRVDATFTDYEMKGRPLILRIIASYSTTQ